MIASAQLTQVVITLLALLVSAHAGGALFTRFRQPRVIGEIVGGLVLGPTILGQVWPEAVAWMFTDDPVVRGVLGFVQQLGIFLLMFCAGVDARRRMRRAERRVTTVVGLVGLVVPFGVGALAVAVLDTRSLWGDNANATSFTLVFASAIAVTSIPVISRIFHDLGLLKTGFARVVLGVAVVEDVILYVVLAVALDLAAPSAPATGLPALLGLEPGSAADICYHSATTVFLLLLLFGVAPRANRWIGSHPVVKGPLAPLRADCSCCSGVSWSSWCSTSSPSSAPSRRASSWGPRDGPMPAGLGECRCGAGRKRGPGLDPQVRVRLLRSLLLRSCRREPQPHAWVRGRRLPPVPDRGLHRQGRSDLPGGPARGTATATHRSSGGSPQRPRRPGHRPGHRDVRGRDRQRGVLQLVGAAGDPHVGRRRQLPAARFPDASSSSTARARPRLRNRSSRKRE